MKKNETMHWLVELILSEVKLVLFSVSAKEQGKQIMIEIIQTGILK
ncbi:hypothetical protein MED121_05750 [Marinomonas sp. MED121]|nr:hypothetical protein MED121_05750 [Marinomonas sp. MED121]